MKFTFKFCSTSNGQLQFLSGRFQVFKRERIFSTCGLQTLWNKVSLRTLVIWRMLDNNLRNYLVAPSSDDILEMTTYLAVYDMILLIQHFTSCVATYMNFLPIEW